MHTYGYFCNAPNYFRSPVAFSRFVNEPRVNSADGLTSNGVQIRNYKVNAKFCLFIFLFFNFVIFYLFAGLFLLVLQPT